MIAISKHILVGMKFEFYLLALIVAVYELRDLISQHFKDTLTDKER